jgi:hypothetical protein
MKKLLENLKPYRAYLLLIAIGIAMLSIVWTSQHWLSNIVGTLGMLLIFSGLVLGTKKMERDFDKKIEEENPYFFNDLVYEKRWQKALKIGAIVFMLLPFGAIGLFRIKTNNLVQEGFYTLVCSAIGIAVASVFTYILLKKIPSLKPNSEAQMNVVSAIWAGIGLSLGVMLISFTFFTAPVSIRKVKVAITEIHENKTRKGNDFIRVKLSDDEIKLRPNSVKLEALQNQDSVVLTIHKSCFLGFEYIDDIQPN